MLVSWEGGEVGEDRPGGAALQLSLPVAFSRPLQDFWIQQCEILHCLSHGDLRARFQLI